MKPIEKIYSPLRYLAATAINIAVVYIAFMICRVVFYIYNKAYFPDMGWDDFRTIFKGGLVFDTSGIVYVNLIYIAAMLVPLPWREGKIWQKTAKWIFVILNSAAVLANLIDTVYFRYTNRRTTSSVFNEFGKEENINNVSSI